MRVAIYARVSTDDGRQDAENQLTQLRAWCVAAGHEIGAEYVDKASGSKSEHKRSRFAALLADAHRRKFDLVLVWALDRLTREGMVATVGYLQRLAAAGVAFHSYSEPALCSDNEMVRDIVLAVMSALAKAERQRISDRTKAGLERVRAKGTRLGRPEIAGAVQQRILAMAAGEPEISHYAIAKALGIDIKTVQRYRAGAS
jgi:DNA invertase Pin-like site-specific DNA recombinase